MKPAGVSTLNPYAAAYVPLAKRDAVDARGGGYGSGGGYAVPEVVKGHLATPGGASGSFYGSSSSWSVNQVVSKSAPVPVVDEEFEMNLDYLRMAFSGMSDESLGDVLMANQGDLEAAIDMLNLLEFDTTESPESLPDSLDIGDVSELVPSAECSSVKLKNVSGEVSASADSVVVT